MTALAKIEPMHTQTMVFDNSQINLLKTTICKGASDDELKFFIYACQRTGLDPFARQIYSVPRGGQRVIQTSVDGFRLIADRSGKYAPGREPTYTYDVHGNLVSATAYVKKQTKDGTWHEVSANARFDEYDGKNTFWKTKSHIMLSKCFCEDTEILTEYGFKKFSEVNGRIMQVTENGIEPIDVEPFCQDYDGDMITYESRDLDFCVTPNHDMITTSGKIEAGTMYEQAKATPSFFIPRIVSENQGDGIGFTQEQCELAAACLCDGDRMSSQKFRIKVSRLHKVEKIRSWNLHEKEVLRNEAGKTTTHSSGRVITTQNDQIEFSFDMSCLSPLVIPYKRLNHDVMMKMNSQEAKWFVDSWALFDGNANSGGGEDRTLRIWSSDPQYLSWLEILGVKAGYSISPRKPRMSDISSKPNYCLSFSTRNEVGVSRWGRKVSEFTREHKSLAITKNTSGKVWCVTVPSGAIVVRRNAFTMVCGNCAECLALRKAFPAEMSGLYGQDEMDQGDVRPSYKDDKLSQSKVIELATLLAQCSVETKENFPKFLVKEYQVELLDDVPASAYERLKKFIDIRRKENQKTLVEKEMGTINVTPEDVK
jgi:RecT family